MTLFLLRRCIPILLVLIPGVASAHEGMWLPTLLKSIEGDLRTAGLRITAEDIYSLNQGSIKDAIVLFGGGCTAEVIGEQGLIMTNHHCGFSQIQRHSSVERDLLKDGFWAAGRSDELGNEGLTATFVVRMEDVTDRIVPQLTPGLSEAQLREAVARLSEPIVREAVDGTHHAAVVRPFNYGNSYYIIVTETFRDVRLVGAPPSAIGKFGGDTDNWMWPRHTGDFSLFRIYAGPDNKPADPSPANIPWTPRYVLPIALDGPQEGGFAMIFGFPGSTQRYLTSYAVRHIQEVQDPMRIAMRRASLEVIDQAMRSSDRTRIQYAAKQASISNAYKKWIGELRGIKELGTLAGKVAYEERYIARARAAGKEDLAAVLPQLEAAYGQVAPYAIARDLFVEMVFYGPEVLRFADRFRVLVEDLDKLQASGGAQAEADKQLAAMAAFYKDFDVEVDKRVFKALLPIYREHLGPELQPGVLDEIDKRFRGNMDAWVDDLYARSALVSPEKMEKLLKPFNARSAKALQADPLIRVSRSFFRNFLEEVRPAHATLSDSIEAGMRTYVSGMMELFPEVTYWPDANSTLRLSYGSVEGSEPRDAVVYGTFTTLDGVMDKYIPGDPEFDLPQRLIDLHAAKDYGAYGVDGTMPVCFTSSLHTTGGNSGSPVLNGHGELIGINFDRSWESTMSDIQFDPAKCRNISMDVRYILFIIDKYAGAAHLLEEMRVVKGTHPPRTIPLPIHR